MRGNISNQITAGIFRLSRHTLRYPARCRYLSQLWRGQRFHRSRHHECVHTPSATDPGMHYPPKSTSAVRVGLSPCTRFFVGREPLSSTCCGYLGQFIAPCTCLAFSQEAIFSWPALCTVHLVYRLLLRRYCGYFSCFCYSTKLPHGEILETLKVAVYIVYSVLI